MLCARIIDLIQVGESFLINETNEESSAGVASGSTAYGQVRHAVMFF